MKIKQVKLVRMQRSVTNNHAEFIKALKRKDDLFSGQYAKMDIMCNMSIIAIKAI
jgi:hypothetical protein